MIRVAFSELRGEFRRILLARGCSAHLADLASRLLAETTCDGVASHGIERFPRLLEDIARGHIVPDAVPSQVNSLGALEQWDGNSGLGNTNASLAMDRAIALARQYGIGCVGLRNTNHWLRGGSYGWQAADAGCIGLCWTNTRPNMAAWGAKDRRIGNNPLVAGVPRAGGHVVVDIAMAQFSFGALGAAKRRGERLAVVGGYDETGALSTDPAAIERTGRVLPIGYWKGAALAVVLDLMAAVLSGGCSTFRVGQLGGAEHMVSQVFIALSVEMELASRVADEVVAHLKASQPAEEGGEIRYPGERVLRVRRENLTCGIPVSDEMWAWMKSVG